MRKFLNLMLLAVSLGVSLTLALTPVRQGQAAPPALPPCGDGAIEALAGRRAGPPDIAQSHDANQFYTAVAWSLGPSTTDEKGDIKLAYSTALTTTGWSHITVDADTNADNQRPAIVFDPANNQLVHVAYQKGNGIFYRQCDLGSGTCNVSRAITSSDANNVVGNVTDTTPEIGIITGSPNKVVIVFQHKVNANELSFIKYASFDADNIIAPLTVQKLTTTAEAVISGEERYPALATFGGRAHIAFTHLGGTGDPVVYTRLEAADLGNQINVDNAAQAARFEHPAGIAITDQDGPQGVNIAAGPYSGIANVAIVWQLYFENATSYNLAYQFSADNGNTWYDSGTLYDYKFLFSGTASNPTGRAPWSTLSTGGGADFDRGLKPAVAIDNSGHAHVVWQAQVQELGSPQEIYYSRLAAPLDTNSWSNNAPADLVAATNSVTGAVTSQYINLTTFYRTATGVPVPATSRFEPAVIFGKPGQRLQVVYMGTLPSTLPSNRNFGIYYNGFQLGTGDEDDSYVFDDSDCDWVNDRQEYSAEAEANCDPGDLLASCDTDGIPNFMDTDSDGDGGADLAEYISLGLNRSITSTLKPIYDASTGLPKVYLPILLKNS